MRQREISAIDATQAYLDRIASLDAKIDAYLTVDAEGALAQAAYAQKLLDAGEGGPLTGVPIALKDNISTDGVETTCASKILKGYVPPFDATVVKMLKAAGCPILGKTNLDEFAMGTSTENSAIKPTRNPYDLERSPGGSSGGSAAAVSAKLAPLALGSDTGGSIRQPASLCGVVGFKPTYGRCSRYGLIAFGSSLDQIGPFARTVEDAALLSHLITGHDPMDSTSLNSAPIAHNLPATNLKGAKVAVPEQLIGKGIQDGVAKVFEETLDRLRAEGAIVDVVSAPSLNYGVTTYYIIAPAEASSNLAKFDGIRFGPRVEGAGHIGMVERTRAELFGHEVKARIMIGAYALSAGYYDAYYVRAQTVRELMTRELNDLFGRYDVIASPTSPTVAFKLGELTGDPMALKLLDLCTIPANMAGIPGISLNCGFDQNLPVGFQLMAAAGRDEQLLGFSKAVEALIPRGSVQPVTA